MDQPDVKPRNRLMDKLWLAVLVTIGFSAFGVLGDYFLKRASLQDYPVKTGAFAVGFTVYASTAFGWLFVMRAHEARHHRRGLFDVAHRPAHAHRSLRLRGNDQQVRDSRDHPGSRVAGVF